RGNSSSMHDFIAYYGKLTGIIEWLKKYDVRLALEDRSDDERSKMMLKFNPKYVLRNYIAQEIIEEVEANSDTKLKQWIEILSHPYDEHFEFEDYSKPTPVSKKNVVVSCSS